MATHAETGRVGAHDRHEGSHPIAPLHLDELDWATVYRIYDRLPPAERRVLDMLVGRKDPKQIACDSGVSSSTVRSQIGSLKHKFDVGSLHELVSIVTITLFTVSEYSSLEGKTHRQNNYDL
ncbi:MAG: hypothetical protein H8E66_25805 [Planctomycetes bacterium]|nr:hypothetical protein [Planctomycetota bacterium]